jgi:hypothetical protein
MASKNKMDIRFTIIDIRGFSKSKYKPEQDQSVSYHAEIMTYNASQVLWEGTDCMPYLLATYSRGEIPYNSLKHLEK